MDDGSTMMYGDKLPCRPDPRVVEFDERSPRGVECQARIVKRFDAKE